MAKTKAKRKTFNVIGDLKKAPAPAEPVASGVVTARDTRERWFRFHRIAHVGRRRCDFERPACIIVALYREIDRLNERKERRS